MIDIKELKEKNYIIFSHDNNAHKKINAKMLKVHSKVDREMNFLKLIKGRLLFNSIAYRLLQTPLPYFIMAVSHELRRKELQLLGSHYHHTTDPTAIILVTFINEVLVTKSNGHYFRLLTYLRFPGIWHFWLFSSSWIFPLLSFFPKLCSLFQVAFAATWLMQENRDTKSSYLALILGPLWKAILFQTSKMDQGLGY